MPIKINGTNTAANPSITGSDTDTGIVYGSDQIDFSTGGSSKVTLNGSNLGIGTTSPSDDLEIASNHSQLRLTDTDDSKFVQFSYSSGKLITRNNSTNTTTAQFTLDESGQMGIGTTSPDRTIHCHNSSNTTNVRTKFSNGTTGEGASDGFEIGINASDPAQAVLVNYENSPMAFFTNATERMRIDSSGNLLVGTTAADGDGLSIRPRQANATTRVNFNRADTSDNGTALQFLNNFTTVGTIKYTNSATQFNTSSDYRLKENAVAISDGITRLKTLKPYRFNFKVKPDTTVDGFFAHEVTAVPEAISGTKDEVVTQELIDSGEYEKGTLNNPIYQGIDQSKLVPLLTAALQEAVAKIEVLETKVAALEAG